MSIGIDMEDTEMKLGSGDGGYFSMSGFASCFSYIRYIMHSQVFEKSLRFFCINRTKFCW